MMRREWMLLSLSLAAACGGDVVPDERSDSGAMAPRVDGGRPASDGAMLEQDAGTTDAGPDVPVALPGSIDGVEPEAHAHHPPMIDRNGNLYRVTESSADDGNNPRMMRSSDGGATWVEVDVEHRPAANDLEGCWQLQVGTSILLSVANSNRVWVAVFHTSDAPERPDQWVLEERVVGDLDNGGGVVQFSSLARTSDGSLWLFHSDTMVSGRQQIAFRRRSVEGVWSAPRSIGERTGSWTGPRAILGSGDVTHVFYTDYANHRLYWRTLSADGDLGAAVRLDVDGTSRERIAHTNAVVYQVDGSERIVVAYADASGALHAVTIVDGVPSAPVAIPNATVLENPDVALNDAPVAHLALDGQTVHVLWADRASGDVMHSVRAPDGAWSVAQAAWSSGDGIAWWVYGNVYVRGGRRRLGFTYDVGEHADDVGRIEYDELTLGPPR